MGQPATYRILIGGQLGPDWTSWFGGLTVRPAPGGTTVLVGQLADQAALHGLLATIRDLGLSLIAVETITRSTETAVEAGSASKPNHSSTPMLVRSGP